MSNPILDFLALRPQLATTFSSPPFVLKGFFFLETTLVVPAAAAAVGRNLINVYLWVLSVVLYTCFLPCASATVESGGKERIFCRFVHAA